MDVSVLRLVVAVLGILAVACVLGLVVVASCGHEPPPALAQIAGNAAAFIGGILVTTKPNGQNNGPKESG